MPLNVAFDGPVAILSNIARLMDDPRHFDAGRDVGDLLDAGRRAFVVDLRNVGSIGPTGLGLLTTITRLIRREGGEIVLTGLRKGMEAYLDEMRMDAYWETFAGVAEARDWFARRDPSDRSTLEP